MNDHLENTEAEVINDLNAYWNKQDCKTVLKNGTRFTYENYFEISLIDKFLNWILKNNHFIFILIISIVLFFTIFYIKYLKKRKTCHMYRLHIKN